MPSINDISIQLNSLFNEIIDPITLGLNKNNFLSKHLKLVFNFQPNGELEFYSKPIFRFDSQEDMSQFLEREEQSANRYQDFENMDELKDVMEQENTKLTIDHFRFNYNIEINKDDILVEFNTNLLIFKYEVIE